jgi:hypothetical protein
MRRRLRTPTSKYMNPSDVSDPVEDGNDPDLDDTGMGDFGDDDD